MSQGFEYRIPAGNFDLPEQERQIAEIIGRRAAILLSFKVFYQRHRARKQCRSGLIYIPKKANSKFNEFIGDSSHAEAICNLYPGEQIHLTGCRNLLRSLRALCVRQLVAHGAPRQLVAKFAGVTERQLRRWCIGDAEREPWPGLKIVEKLKELDALRCQINYEPPCWHGDRESEADEW